MCGAKHRRHGKPPSRLRDRVQRLKDEGSDTGQTADMERALSFKLLDADRLGLVVVLRSQAGQHAAYEPAFDRAQTSPALLCRDVGGAEEEQRDW